VHCGSFFSRFLVRLFPFWPTQQQRRGSVTLAAAIAPRRTPSRTRAAKHGASRAPGAAAAPPRAAAAKTAKPTASYAAASTAEWALEPLRVNGRDCLLDRATWRLYAFPAGEAAAAAAADGSAAFPAPVGRLHPGTGAARLRDDASPPAPEFFSALETRLRSRPELRLRDAFASAAATAATFADAADADAAASPPLIGPDATLGGDALSGVLRAVWPGVSAADVAYFCAMVDPSGGALLSYPRLAAAMQAATAAGAAAAAHAGDAAARAAVARARARVEDGLRCAGVTLGGMYRRYAPPGAPGLKPPDAAALLSATLAHCGGGCADPDADVRLLLARLRAAAPDAAAAAAITLGDLHAELRIEAPAIAAPPPVEEPSSLSAMGADADGLLPNAEDSRRSGGGGDDEENGNDDNDEDGDLHHYAADDGAGRGAFGDDDEGGVVTDGEEDATPRPAASSPPPRRSAGGGAGGVRPATAPAFASEDGHAAHAHGTPVRVLRSNSLTRTSPPTSPSAQQLLADAEEELSRRQRVIQALQAQVGDLEADLAREQDAAASVSAAAAEAHASADAAEADAAAARQEAAQLRAELEAVPALRRSLRDAREAAFELRRALERERTRAAGGDSAAAAGTPGGTEAAGYQSPRTSAAGPSPWRERSYSDGGAGGAPTPRTLDAAAAAASAASAAASAASASALEAELRGARAALAALQARADAESAALAALRTNHAAALRQLEATHGRLGEERASAARLGGEERRLAAELSAARELAPLLAASRAERAALEEENRSLMAAALAAPAHGAELRRARAALQEACRGRAEAEGSLADARRELLAYAPAGGGEDYRTLRAERDALRAAAERARVELTAAHDALTVYRSAAAAAAATPPASPAPAARVSAAASSPPATPGLDWEAAEEERARLAGQVATLTEQLRTMRKQLALLEAQVADLRAELDDERSRAASAASAASEREGAAAQALQERAEAVEELEAALAARQAAMAAMAEELRAANASAREARTSAAAAAAAAAAVSDVEEEEAEAAAEAAAAEEEHAHDEPEEAQEEAEEEVARVDTAEAAAARLRRRAELEAAEAEAYARAVAEEEAADAAAAEAEAAEAEAAEAEAAAQAAADAEDAQAAADALAAADARAAAAAAAASGAPDSPLGPPPRQRRDSYIAAASRASSGDEADEAPWDDSLGDDENVLELTLHSVAVDRAAVRGEAHPTTFLTVDFFEHETQATPLASGFSPEIEQAYEFVVLVDNLFLQYMETDFLRFELNVAHGLEFRKLGAAAFPLRRLLHEVEAGRGGGRGGRGAHAVQFRAPGGDVVGTLTLSLRLQRPMREELLAYRAQMPFGRSGALPAPLQMPASGEDALRSSFEFPRLPRSSSGGSTGAGGRRSAGGAVSPSSAAIATLGALPEAPPADPRTSVTIRVSHAQLGPEARADASIRGALVLFDFLGDVFPEADQRTRAVAKPPGGRLDFDFSRAFPVGRANYPAAFAALASALAPPAREEGAEEEEEDDEQPVDPAAVLQFLLVADPGGGAQFRDIGAAELRLADVLAGGDLRDVTLQVLDARGAPVGSVTVSVTGAEALAAAAHM
jgi:hypothetical protein